MIIKRLFSKAVALGLGLASLACFSLAGAAALVDEVPVTTDLTREAALSQSRQLPVMILFSAPKCPYCERVKQEFLVPMLRNPEYEGKVIIRQIEYQSRSRLVDFSGKATTPAQFSLLQKVRLTPTIKLFDAEGHVLTEPLVGLTTPDYYGAYLDRAIDEALAKIRAPSR
ncbi:MAG: thioredoxin family protein [Sulfuricella denitrificans]|nr:thioredoxin family protein [Sulfuricella denitrificans]